MRTNNEFTSLVSLLENILGNFNDFCGNKEEFVQSDDSLAIAISLFKQIYDYIFDDANDFFILNKRIAEFKQVTGNFNNNLFDEFGLVNGYKLYDFFAVDVANLYKELKKIS